MSSKTKHIFVSDTFYTCSSDTILLSGQSNRWCRRYSYRWTTKQLTLLRSDTIAEPQFNSLAQSKYQMTYLVTDSKGCKTSQNIVIVK